MRKLMLYSVLFLLVTGLAACHHVLPADSKSIEGHKDSVVTHWINWNILFTPAAAGNTAAVIQTFEDYLTHYADSANPTAGLQFHVSHCPCDPQLTNLDATLLWGSGNSVPVPPTSPNPKPSGDYVLSTNWTMAIPDFIDTGNHVDLGNLTTDKSVFVPGGFADGSVSKLLAVIDTGLDTLTFKFAFPKTIWEGNLLWTKSSATGAVQPGPTVFDVVPGESVKMLIDDNHVKHGTAATGISLSQIHSLDPSRIPKIMSIRAFDSAERGSIYTAGCAMNCAIENHADYINASWGYFGKEDSILKYYLTKANNQHIVVVAAAGNTPGGHLLDSVCGGGINPQNNLTRLKSSDSLFYPACFAPDLSDLISVTQLKRQPPAATISPCYYQNYSEDYITVGALESPPKTVPCCSFRVPYLLRNIEGSSFATPVVTGILIATRPDSRQVSLKKFINGSAHHKKPFYTSNGSYLDFQSFQ